jgi:prolyl-tRNA synthetase
MKDLYSFSKDEKEHQHFYEKAQKAYINIYNEVGLGKHTYMTFASGGSFSKYSHEFQVLTESGEDTIYIDEKKSIAVNKEVLNDEVLQELGVMQKDLVEKKAIEVGNIFSLGTKFSKPLGLEYTDEDGTKKNVIMGCYGIGLGRLMGTVAEVLSDEKGLIWPMSIAPFHVHLVALHDKEGKVKKEADKLYEQLSAKDIEVLYDDRDMRPGEKFADSDLIGIPIRIVLSEKTMADNLIEVKDRKSGEVQKIGAEEFLNKFRVE